MQYLPDCGIKQVGAEYGIECKEGPHLGLLGAYGYRFAKNLSIGLGASIHGRPFVSDVNDGWANVFSAPVLFTFDPHLSNSVRLVMIGGLGYEHAWGQYYGGGWKADGLGVSVDLGAAVEVVPRLEILGTVGVRGGLLAPKFDYATSYSGPLVLDVNLPFGLGLRYSL
jgi:hypothetical protein